MVFPKLVGEFEITSIHVDEICNRLEIGRLYCLIVFPPSQFTPIVTPPQIMGLGSPKALWAPFLSLGALRATPSQHQVERPAAAGVGAGVAEVGQEVVGVAPGVLERVGQDRQGSNMGTGAPAGTSESGSPSAGAPGSAPP